jgi:hypothetical protein
MYPKCRCEDGGEQNGESSHDQRGGADKQTLSGRAAIVTGSTSGIGLAIARALADSGANVVLNGFGDLKEIEKIRNSILNEFGTAVIYVPADMAQPNDIDRLIEITEETFGRVDILVNNAGVQHVVAIETFPVEKWDQILAINLSSAFHTIWRVIAGMKARGFGRISMSPSHTRWSPHLSSRLMSPPSMGSSASQRPSPLRLPRTASPTMQIPETAKARDQWRGVRS